MAIAPPVNLASELALYEAKKAEWLERHRDEFVVIKKSEIVGFFPDFHNAYKAAVERFGIDSDFLVKRVAAQEPVFVVF